MNLKELIFGEGVHTGGSGGVYRDSVQAWLPIKNIIGGVVITKDNRFVKIMEVLPVNIYLKSAIDRQNIISSFASYLQIAPDELQMIARTLPADTQAYVEQMQRYAEQEENEACREMIEDNIREIGHGIAGGAMRHRFFLVFQYEPSMRAKRNTVQAIIQRLNEEADTARRYLDLCELEVLEPQYSDNFVLKLLYEILNKKTSQRVRLPEGVFDKNEQAFLSALPILALDPDIERKARRNALTSGVAAAFPFVSYELSDHDGIFLGLNLYNRSPVFLNPYDDYKYTSGNWWIGGSTGAGKTVTLQCLGGRLREQGKRVIIIVPKKGHEFRPLCERLGGLYLRMSPSSKDCPNLMAIRRKSLDSYAKLKNIAARDDSVLADKIAQLIIWFSLKKKDLNEEDKSRLDSSLVEVYKRYGITFDNSTIVDENGNFRTIFHCQRAV